MERLNWYRSDAYVKGVTFTQGASFTGWSDNSRTNSFVAADCEFNGAPGADQYGNGMNVFLRSGFSFMTRCSARSNSLDGFSYKSMVAGSTAWMLEVDCVGTDNGINNACNGSTLHDGWSGVRLNGIYERNQECADKIRSGR